MLVCHCTVVNDSRLRELVAEGAEDLLDIASATGAGSFCGGCVPAIASLLSRETGEPASAILDRAPSRVDDTSLPTRVRQVVRAIEEETFSGDHPPSTPLVDEAELARRHDATPGTVRDALLVLRQHGTVRDGPDGLVVGDPDVEVAVTAAALHLRADGATAEDVLDTRRVVEGLAVRCACTHPDEPAWEAFVDTDQNPDKLADPDFRQRLVDVAGNPVLSLFAQLLQLLASTAPTEAAAHTAIVAAVAARDAPHAAELLAADLATCSGTTTVPNLPTTADTGLLGLARTVCEWITDQALGPGEVIGTDKEVAERLGVDRRTLRDVTVWLEYHGLATHQPGPQATLAVATPDPWPSAELLALLLDRAEVAPGQLLHARQALEVHAVERASTTLDEQAAARLRRRLDEESTIVERDRVRNRMFHTIHPLLARLSGNPVLAHLAIATNLALVRRANRDEDLARLLSSSVGEATSAHSAIVDAATRGDTATSRVLMDDHVARHATHHPA